MGNTNYLKLGINEALPILRSLSLDHMQMMHARIEPNSQVDEIFYMDLITEIKNVFVFCFTV